MIAPSYLGELRRRVALPALIGRHVKLVRQGAEYQGLCPFHAEKTPSFYVVPQKGMWHCFGCGAHGDAIGFVMRHDGVDFLEAVQRLGALVGAGTLGGRAGERVGAVVDADASPHLIKMSEEISQISRIKREEARAIWLAASPLAPGDMAWRYLLGRGIDLAALGRVPGALRFHPRCWLGRLGRHFPALVAAVSDDSAAAGGHLSTHCTFLFEEGRMAAKLPDSITGGDKKLQRRCYGSYRGGSIKLTRGRSGKPWRQAPAGDRLLLGEGIEDTLTAASALPDCRSAAMISGGNARNILLPEGIRQVILVAQNDRPKRPDGTLLPNWWARAEAHFRGLGRDVARLQPPVFVKDINDYQQWLREHPLETADA